MSGPREHEPCPCVCVADNEVGAVSVCPECSVVTLRLQYISLRFETEAFERVASLVQRAQMRLGGGAYLGKRLRDGGDADEPLQKPH